MSLKGIKMRDGKEKIGVKWVNLSRWQENPSVSHILFVSKIKYSVSLELSEANHHNGPLTSDLHHFLWRQMTEKEGGHMIKLSRNFYVMESVGS